MSVSTESVERRAAELADAQQVRAWLLEVAPAERSRQIGELSPGELSRFAALLGPRTGAEVMRSVEPDVAAELVRALDPRSSAHLIESLDFDDAAEVLRRLRGPDRDALLAGVDADFARGTTAILSALSLRAGALVARGRLRLDQAEPMAIAMIHRSNQRIARASRAGLLDERLQGA